MSNKILMPTSLETLSPDELLKAIASDKDNIKSSKFIPPAIGENGYGSFDIEYSIPVLREKRV